MSDKQRTQPAADILSKLNDECAKLRAFVVLLEEEQQTLLGQHPEDLLPLAESKTQLADSLASLLHERQQRLDGTGSDMAEWLKRKAPKGLPLWEEIRQLATHVQRLNQTNGELIQIKLRYNQQALGALYNAAQTAAGLYGPNGQTHMPSSGRMLGSV